MKDIFSGYEVVSFYEAKALSILMEHYAQSDMCGESICFGHNNMTGWYYIAFENYSMQIALDPKENVFWIVTDIDTGEEEFFTHEEEAAEYLVTIE